MGTMFDTVLDPRKTFAGLKVEAVAAYANGKFANYEAAKREFSNVPVLEIDVLGEGVGDTGDFEPGDMSASNAGSWAKGRMAAGVERPVLYFSVSQWTEVIRSLHAAGVRRRDVRIWTAHYTGREHRCSAACGFGVQGVADATQWGSADFAGTLPPPYKGHVMDISLTDDDFFGDAPAGISTAGSGKAHPAAHVPPFPGRELGQPPPMTGNDVHRWQAQMARRGWAIVVNSTYDAASEHICRQFQEEKGLHVDGVVGENTWRAAWAAPVTTLARPASASRSATATPSGAAVASAKRLLAFSEQGKYHADNPGDLNDIKATAAGRAVHNVNGAAVHIDERVMRVLVFLIEKGHTIGTFAICSDHHDDGPHGHAGGMAVDISTIDGHAVASASARAVVIKLDTELHHAGELTPRQLISGGVGNVRDQTISALSIPGADSFYGADTMAQHCNHVHVGY